MQATTTIGGPHRRGLAGSTRTGARVGTVGRTVTIAAACLIEALLILGFIGATLGLGYEGHAPVGPGRLQPPPATSAPAPAPGF